MRNGNLVWSGGIVRAFGYLVAATAMVLCAAPARAQDDMPSKVPIAFNRYRDHAELNKELRELAAAYPELVRLETIGKSRQGREMIVAVVTSPKHGADTTKPAMWIDGNVHGNEVQAAEVVNYTLWYVTKAYGKNERLTDLLDRTALYLLPCVNPDGRQYWFDGPNTPNSSRQSQRPDDDDRDGLIDEDGPDDLDGDGQLTQMWRRDPNGRWVRSQTDQRVYVRLREDQKAAPGVETWESAGQEGIDNDNDGSINEDGPGGDDMNRNWPSDWQPEFVQGGAGLWPLEAPETRAVAAFIKAHPNIGAGQSYHNAGGMILRGPGSPYRENMYPREDLRVYDEIARAGEQMLPYYRYLIIHSQLYPVKGGFVNWLAEGLGIFAFTNEMWIPAKYFQREVSDPSEEQDWLWRDRLAFGQLFTEYKEFDHPFYGKVLIGGLNKWSGRNTPTFLLEEECHRNFAFTMFHADQLPRLRFDRVEVAKLPAGAGGGGLWQVTVEVRNDRLIPTRSALQARERIGTNDVISVEGAMVVAAGRLGNWFARQMDEVRYEPSRVQVADGIPGRGGRIFRFIVSGREGEKVTLRYRAERASEVSLVVELKEGRGG